ncbi:MAG: cupin domain-containing protein, partial [Nitrospirae bacterium]|nr:cupin domain-containing protein [Nitrospirota bacterium]
MSYGVDVSSKPYTNGNLTNVTKANDRPSCRLNSSQSTYLAKQGYPYHSGISVHTAGSKAIAMHTVTIPPGAREKAHLHRDHETTVYLISGEIKLWFGENLEESCFMHDGDFLYIPQNVPHL